MVTFSKLSIPAANLGTLNPMPDIKNVSYIHAGYEITDKISDDEKKYIGKGMIPTMIPYQMQDGYDRSRNIREFNTAVVENDHIRAVFLPELGGRLYSLTDKDRNRELLYVNPVFQPGNLGLRNAWFSGGVEFNVGIKGHNPLTCSPLHTVIDKTGDGDVLRMYEYERIRGVVYSVSAWVGSDSNILYLRCRIENIAGGDKYMYWWSIIAVSETPGTRVIVPAEEAFLSFYNSDHYTVDKASIPVHEDMDVSYPCRIPSSRDFFYKIPESSHKWIAAVNEEGKGLLHCSSKKLYGRKLFVWGMGCGGRHWNEWLSEKGSAYIEIQAGLAHTQLEHIPMKSGETWEWTEAYIMLEGEPEIFHGDYKAAVSYISAYLNDSVGDPEKMYFPSDEDVTQRVRLNVMASGWGWLEEKVCGKRLSSTLEFTESEDEEIQQWKNLLEKGCFPNPDPMSIPGSYVTGKFWLDLLTGLKEKNWYSLLHEGVIRYQMYANGNADIDSVREVWEKSLQKTPNPWALRNLSMLYRSELGDREKARYLILEAFHMKPDCLSLVQETAMQLIGVQDEVWLAVYDNLSEKLKENGRLKLCRAAALIHMERLEEAADILCESFTMPDIKEGELSVSHLWFELYRRKYAKENGIPYSAENQALIDEADIAYPLPASLDFRMH